MKGLVKLREEVHNRAMTFRTIENIVLRPMFTRLWIDSTSDERKIVEDIIKRGNRKQLNRWMRDHPSVNLGEKPFRNLRELGRKLGIKNYPRLDRPQLITAIIQRETSYGQTGESRAHEGTVAGDGTTD